MTLELFPSGLRWQVTHRQDQRLRALADRHYSRQTPGDRQFARPGEGCFLVTDDATAGWVVIHNVFHGVRAWRCTLFRNEGPHLSSSLVVEATERTRAWWPAHYGHTPAVPLRTEVDPSKTRRKRDPGRCFRRAGWHVVGVDRDGRVVLEAS